MDDSPKAIVVDEDELVEKLNRLLVEGGGDLARVIEFLLLENHMHTLEQSSGFRRGVQYDFSEFPRFLKLCEEPSDSIETP